MILARFVRSNAHRALWRELHASRRVLDQPSHTTEVGQGEQAELARARVVSSSQAKTEKKTKEEPTEDAGMSTESKGESRKDGPKSGKWQRVSQISSTLTLAAAAAGGVWAYFNQELVTEKIKYFTEPSREKLLPDPVPYPGGKPLRTLVIELDDTLVHSMWSRSTGWRTTKRPGVEAFLAYLASFYEIVLFTSQLPSYADPVLDKLDPSGYIMHRLYRDATKYIGGVHIKDLSKLNRDLSRTIVIDADPAHFRLQPSNGVQVPKWDRDPKDRALLDLIPFLEYIVREDIKDVRPLLASYAGTNVGDEFMKRRASGAASAAAAAAGSGPARLGGLGLGFSSSQPSAAPDWGAPKSEGAEGEHKSGSIFG
eukprot:CAMPEP_0198728788 /NCGR_PEP_ID=MMETSP1475-20131203/11720_1 /TAXON_ID= ORGANISM="Unidentified sp., Strain CCMP1999" /NCGR_SAMPLE_ID=MMETSP1475 /ASSEMBLY_ACC=CAM_ASM_001111 /LENGTH=368 /DNA_ID=CAMNT_0044491255 /DNA_START=86 /DNA_END=1189 /DNA_ORIENTATION=-